ncbi:hypothetical protein, partial [Klebsiella pneumoniae]|uniref:hypothetical protein n=1 Tax=Klebsiella pneumoniae TaxID=573 RepID=UPI001952A89F
SRNSSASSPGGRPEAGRLGICEKPAKARIEQAFDRAPTGARRPDLFIKQIRAISENHQTSLAPGAWL